MKDSYMKRAAALCATGVLIVTACSDPNDKTGKDLPAYYSCQGKLKAELVAELDQSSKNIRLPEQSTADVVWKPENSQFVCNLGSLYSGISMSIDVATDDNQLAGSYSPPEAQVIPLSDLEGSIESDSADLVVECTRGGKSINLASRMTLPSTDNLENPKTRLAMARVLVDMTNNARERFGCSEPALPLPKDLPPIPELAPPPGEDELESDPQCPVATPPGFELRGDERLWVVRTPQPSKMVSVCETRVVDDNSTDPLVMLVTYKRTLASAYQESPEHSMPRYDTTCHGIPVSYRVYVRDPDDRDGYVNELPDTPEYQQLLDDMASAAATQHGCTLSAS